MSLTLKGDGKVSVRLRPFHAPQHGKRERAEYEDHRRFGGRNGTGWFESDDGKKNRRKDWLIYDETANVMKCLACCRFSKVQNNFMAGTKSVRLEVVTRHEKDGCTNGHNGALETLLNQGKMVSDWNQAVNNQIISAQDEIITTIAAVYWLCKEQIALRKTPSLLRLLEQRGVKVSKLYRNKYAAAQFTRCLAQVIRKWRLNEMRKAGYYGMMIDEGTDIGYDSILIVYTKFVNPENGAVCARERTAVSASDVMALTVSAIVCIPPSPRAQVRTRFHRLLELESKSADSLTTGIFQMLDEDALLIEKCVSTGADGASTMQGELSGVTTQIKERSPFNVSHHDLAHREALACGDATENASPWEMSNIIAQTEADLNLIVSDHNRSCKRIRALAEICRKLGLRVKRLHHGCITRWLTRHQMSDGVWRSLLALAEEYEKENDRDRFAMIMCARFIIITAYHADITEQLNSLSKRLQVDHISYRAAKRIVRATQTKLRQMYLADDDTPASYFPNGKRMATLKEAVQAALASTGEGGDCVLKVFGRDVSFSSQAWAEYSRVIRTYSASHVEHLAKRFPDDPFMEAFDCLELDGVPIIKDGETENAFVRRLELHGVDSLNILLDHYARPFRSEDGKIFSPLVDRDTALEQYNRLKSLVVQLRADNEKKPVTLRQELTSDALWEHFFMHKSDYGYDVQTMLDLRVLELTQALTTSCAERGISTLGQIKTKLRNRLHVPTTDSLMEIYENGPDPNDKEICEALYSEAFRLFTSTVKRNPNKEHFKPRPRGPREVAAPSTSRPACQPLSMSSDDEEVGELEAELNIGNGADDEDDDEPEEDLDEETRTRRLQALYDSVGDFPGMEGWVVMEEAPTSYVAELKKPNVKIAHKFNTGEPASTPSPPCVH